MIRAWLSERNSRRKSSKELNYQVEKARTRQAQLIEFACFVESSQTPVRVRKSGSDFAKLLLSRNVWGTAKMLKRLLVCLLTVAAISLFSRDAAADVFDFSCISNNSATNCGVVESQLLVEIELNANGMVDFLFTNSGPTASSITDIYFDDTRPLLGGTVQIWESSGVNFSAGCSPGNLPGGNPYGFTTAYCADSNSPTQPNGVNPNESLRLSYALQGGSTLDDVLSAIAAGSFQVGIHTQGFANGGSESAIINRASVPEPSTIMLLGIGAVATLVRRRKIA